MDNKQSVVKAIESTRIRRGEKASLSNETEASCYINEIPLELLGHIFNFLTIKDRIRLDRICKRWREANRILHWNQEETLDLTCANCKQRSIFTALEKYGRKIGGIAFVKKNFGDVFKQKWIRRAISHCPNLQRIFLENQILTNETFHHLAKTCGKLKKFASWAERGFGDVGVEAILKNCPIEYFELSRSLGVKGWCLRSLDGGVKTLALYYLKNFNTVGSLPGQDTRGDVVARNFSTASVAKPLSGGATNGDRLPGHALPENDSIDEANLLPVARCRRHKRVVCSGLNCLRINRLEIFECSGLPASEIVHILNCAAKCLTSLRLFYMKHLDYDSLRNGLCFCENLESLWLSDNIACDETLELLSKSCSRLVNLHIEHPAISSGSLRILSRYTSLRKVVIYYSSKNVVTDASIKVLSGNLFLKEIDIIGHDIENGEGVVSLLEGCSDLGYFRISPTIPSLVADVAVRRGFLSECNEYGCTFTKS